MVTQEEYKALLEEAADYVHESDTELFEISAVWGLIHKTIGLDKLPSEFPLSKVPMPSAFIQSFANLHGEASFESAEEEHGITLPENILKMTDEAIEKWLEDCPQFDNYCGEQWRLVAIDKQVESCIFESPKWTSGWKNICEFNPN